MSDAQLPGMSQFAALVVELAAKLGAAVPSAKAPSLSDQEVAAICRRGHPIVTFSSCKCDSY